MFAAGPSSNGGAVSATAFNSDISTWSVAKVINMEMMFAGDSLTTTSFNGDITAWDVSGVTVMRKMFYFARGFNQDISIWDISRVTSVGEMFFMATSFQQDLCSDEWIQVRASSLRHLMYKTVIATDMFDSSPGAIKCCAAGQYYFAATRDCMVCRTGQFQPQNTTKPRACKTCRAGQSVGNRSASACSACSPGKFVNSDSDRCDFGCKLCPTGKHTDEEGSTTCKFCPAGLYEDERGSRARGCKACSQNMYSAGQGAETCFACKNGSFTYENGAIECVSFCCGMRKLFSRCCCAPQQKLTHYISISISLLYLSHTHRTIARRVGLPSCRTQRLGKRRAKCVVPAAFVTVRWASPIAQTAREACTSLTRRGSTASHAYQVCSATSRAWKNAIFARLAGPPAMLVLTIASSAHSEKPLTREKRKVAACAHWVISGKREEPVQTVWPGNTRTNLGRTPVRIATLTCSVW